jgi:hypothetical protein
MPIGEVPFVVRPVYLDADGWQYVVEDARRPVFGTWILVDEPSVVIPES